MFGRINQRLPVLPSKRAAQHAAVVDLTNDKSNKISSHAYLPQELANIVLAKQRQERAWHTCLSICTYILSNVGSTFSIYKEDIEKEEADIIRKYLQKAIAYLVASDNAPKLPEIPIESKPSKMKSVNLLRNSKIIDSHVANSKTPTLSSQNYNLNIKEQVACPKQTENSWVMVARNGHTKARTIAHLSTPSTSQSTKHNLLPSYPHHQKRNAHKKKTGKENKSDNRLFMRLPTDHEWRMLSPAGLREVIVKRLSISPASIGLIKLVRSGFAISPSNDQSRKNILAAAGGLFMSGATLEAASNWIPLPVPTDPRSITMLEGQVEVTKSMLADEIERVSTIRPTFVKPYGASNPDAPHRTWMAFFSEIPRTGFRVFHESGVTRNFKKKQQIEFCKRCNGHPNIRTCSRAPSCGNCGSTTHSQDICMAATKCRNCGGPHRSDSHRCLARPTRTSKPTKEQLKVYRKAGDREYQAVVRANAAEARALSAEQTDQVNETPDSSQIPEANAEDSNIAPVTTSTGVEIAL
ncbi:putative eka-like protein [Erysiphe necator]|uniref:Putative eka-like protein n=1 Tax=Uncinula necator TaxID=52586 RepID=A0A0B1P6X3_UNCNE|nr:putative eka-like protein [Erysiphe necator]